MIIGKIMLLISLVVLWQGQINESRSIRIVAIVNATMLGGFIGMLIYSLLR